MFCILYIYSDLGLLSPLLVQRCQLLPPAQTLSPKILTRYHSSSSEILIRSEISFTASAISANPHSDVRAQSKIWFICIKDHREGEELTDSLSFRLLCSPLLSPDGVSPGWHRLWLCSDTSARCWLPRLPSLHLLTWFSHLSLSRVLVTWSLTWNVDFIISC